MSAHGSPDGTAAAPRALIACTPNELHETGPRMLVDLLEDDGWEVDFCGSTVSMRNVIATIRAREPRFVGLSVALARHLDGAVLMIAEIREALGPQAPPIVVGGNAFRGDPERWRQVGADLYLEDAAAAVTALRRYKA